ncbi:DUF1440 domain-containing protein [uncultured Sphingomonas sp.]|uniref:DUF1440 domain-containing protein n=1 Tax=uncultured Sphingomonas sp. TaxID=158754 RepID=UPI00374A50D0
MPSLFTTALIGVGAGLAASFVMDRFQDVAAPAFGMDGGDDDPATVKAADTISNAVEGRPVTQKHREAAGSAMHYALGAAIGGGYALAVRQWPKLAKGWGVPAGLTTMLLLDDLMVPAAGWGPWPEADVPSNAYGLASHLVFGVAMEGARRAGAAAVEALPA